MSTATVSFFSPTLKTSIEVEYTADEPGDKPYSVEIRIADVPVREHLYGTTVDRIDIELDRHLQSLRAEHLWEQREYARRWAA